MEILFRTKALPVFCHRLPWHDGAGMSEPLCLYAILGISERNSEKVVVGPITAFYLINHITIQLHREYLSLRASRVFVPNVTCSNDQDIKLICERRSNTTHSIKNGHYA
ncbi:hypothetical protein VCUG_02420 [Vavraia culicis subsp. floridensis]|uniref:Uncharacterized protein n=1 Tax=Vavraia culicis (isolate floridensis) TaxID=948595 RepID=L2GSM0_VAVCU|nr:uncharacterized protein VCUG_02420 [Vavraia culicis subsp. floridensis]ELA46085.1 hypothetical protein VCUG_02420 [Vavraia culicis subsp. floridensis]